MRHLVALAACHTVVQVFCCVSPPRPVQLVKRLGRGSPPPGICLLHIFHCFKYKNKRKLQNDCLNEGHIKDPVKQFLGGNALFVFEILF